MTTEMFRNKLYPSIEPKPPTMEIISAPDRRGSVPALSYPLAGGLGPSGGTEPKSATPPMPSEVKPPRPPFRFEFKKSYYSIYTTKGEKFVLREEHLEGLKRLTAEFNRHNPHKRMPLSMSDIVNAALDFVFEHPLNVRFLASSEEVRDAIAREVYRKAFFQFLVWYEMF